MRAKSSAFAAAFSGLLVAVAFAQPGTPGQTDRQDVPRTGVGGIQRPGDASRPGMNESSRMDTNNPSQTMTRGGESEVERYLATCLLLKNEGEVEISQFAQERAQNPQVKQFAQQLIADHQALLPKLRQIAGAQAGADSTRSSQTGVQQSAMQQEIRPGGQPAGMPQPGTAQPGGVTPPTYTPQPGTEAGRTQGTASGERTVRETTTERTGQITTGAASSERTMGQQSQGAVGQLAAIEKQIAQRANESLREKLQEKQGPEFDKCFVGSQIAGHMHMLAALEVIEKQPNAGELQQVAQQAHAKVKEHLAHAEQLAKQLDGNTSRQAGADRPIEGVPR